MVEKLLEQRTEFLRLLDAESARNAAIIAETSKNVENFRQTATNIEEISKKVEHPALVPLGKNIYVNATIKHTGEYYVDKTASPASYSTLETAATTVRLLGLRAERAAKDLETARGANDQIEERRKILIDDGVSAERIVSDRGTAVRVGEFYEILEYED